MVVNVKGLFVSKDNVPSVVQFEGGLVGTASVSDRYERVPEGTRAKLVKYRGRLQLSSADRRTLVSRVLG